MTLTEKVLPAPPPFVHPEVKPFWEATAEGRLVLPKCLECDTLIWYPRPFCPNCASTRVEWIAASGRGSIYSFTVNRRGQADLAAYREAGVYVLAYVELEEGPRVMTNIVDCDPDSVRIGQQVEVVFHDTGQGTALPRFRPRGA
ncbi:MAG: Zn-ribbon domain-containing OB-fold protein [Chloroflexi bacterium]|nr:MAG: Zn-ribbon domain-containing OB-fold protein [Chloroflexota bacterium]